MTDNRPSAINPHVRDVFNRAKAENFGLRTLYDNGDKNVRWPLYLYEPSMPGEMIYPERFGVTAARIMGADPAYRPHDPRDIPQFAIDAMHRSFVAGLNLFFPPAELAAYVREKIAVPGFMGCRVEDDYYALKMESLPRAHRAASGASATHGNAFRASQEADIRFADPAQPIDDPARIRQDRRVLTAAELRAAYDYSRQNPDLWVAFLLWQTAVHDYAVEMGTLLNDYDKAQVLQLHQPQIRFLDFVSNTVKTLNSFQFFNIAHIVQLALQRGHLAGVDDATPLRAQDIRDGIMLARKNGIYRRAFDSQFGARKVNCPFGNHATRWQIESLTGESGPENGSLVLCYDKVRAARPVNEFLHALCTNVRDRLTKVLQECDPAPQPPVARPGCPYAALNQG